MSTQKENKIPKPGIAVATALTALFATCALAQDTGFSPKGNGYQKASDLPAQTTVSGTTAGEGTEGYKEIKSHFNYKHDKDEVWVEPTVDDNDPSLWDGTEKSFSYDQVVNLYTDNPPDIEIDNMLKKVSKMPIADARNYLHDNTKRIIKARTALRPTKPGEQPRCPEVEHLMCFVMDRGLELADIVHTLASDQASSDKSKGHRQPGVLAQEVRILAEALNMARDFYKPVVEYAMNPKHGATEDFHPKYNKFGRDFADKFMVINEGNLNAKAQYAVAFTILGYFAYDLQRPTVKGEDNAILRKNQGAAHLLAQTMSAKGMFTPDAFPDDGPGTGFRLLKNIQTLWEAYYDAKGILDNPKYAPGQPLEIPGRHG